ncbi:olfactory receptor 2T1-like [Astyanax mexicanus]|uniref:Olfactory receptor 2T1-like n=1 Tax=Astyanax mexicanus TaxID=7994 RepID=A0A8T2M707_ASTMX|nr:olfactory receptor 2T1-like [Astyanax mexicanus]
MNSSVIQLAFEELISKNCIIVFLGFTIICINGTFVFTFYQSSVLYTDPRYILYVHLVVNDMLMVWISVTLYVMSYVLQSVNMVLCSVLLIIASTTQKNSPLNLAGMAVERYIAICKPLHHPHICTIHRTYILICLIWVAGAIPPVTDLIISSVLRPFNVFSTVSFCASSAVYVSVYHDERNKAVQGIYMSTVWIIVVFTYCRVLLTARKISTNKVSAKKAQNTIMLHGVQLLLCMLSYATPVLDTVLVLLMPAQQRNIRFWNYFLTNIIPRLLSPLIYGVRDQTFVKHMKKIFLGRMLIVKIEQQ